jgi:hypothetical protein
MARDTHLRQSPTKGDRAAIIRTCFGDLSLCQNGSELTEEYFSYYSQQLNSLTFQYGQAGTWEFPLGSHKEVLDIVCAIREAGSLLTKSQLRLRLRERPHLQSCSDSNIDSIIDAGLRFWLMVNFRSPGDKVYDSGRSCVEWRTSITLRAQLESLFKKSATKSGPGPRRLSPRFSVVTMRDICGLEVSWTSCLAEHLRLDRQKKILWVFTNRHFLLAASRMGEIER